MDLDAVCCYLQVTCVETSLVILYIVLVCAFFGWGLFHKTRERRNRPSSMEPLLNVADNSEIDVVNLRKDGKLLSEVDLNYFYDMSCTPVIHPSPFYYGVCYVQYHMVFRFQH